MLGDGNVITVKKQYGFSANKPESGTFPVHPAILTGTNGQNSHRQGFRDHLAEYTDALHAHNPDFQVCSNWGIQFSYARTGHGGRRFHFGATSPHATAVNSGDGSRDGA